MLIWWFWKSVNPFFSWQKYGRTTALLVTFPRTQLPVASEPTLRTPSWRDSYLWLATQEDDSIYWALTSIPLSVCFGKITKHLWLLRTWTTIHKIWTMWVRHFIFMAILNFFITCILILQRSYYWFLRPLKIDILKILYLADYKTQNHPIILIIILGYWFP